VIAQQSRAAFAAVIRPVIEMPATIGLVSVAAMSQHLYFMSDLQATR
jgi:ACR3 family arsenite efflux pump ArsB